MSDVDEKNHKDLQKWFIQISSGNFVAESKWIFLITDIN